MGTIWNWVQLTKVKVRNHLHDLIKRKEAISLNIDVYRLAVIFVLFAWFSYQLQCKILYDSGEFQEINSDNFSGK